MIKSDSFLYVQYDPLNITHSMKEEGGTVKQVYYSGDNVFMPNRQIAPLTLQPSIVITDPNDIIPNGDKSGSLSLYKWYVGSITPENEVTTREADATVSTPYALGDNASLVVRRNVSPEYPETLFFEGDFFDTRRGSTVHVSMTVLLTTTSNAESVPLPTMSLSKPFNWVYNPLKGISNQSIKATLFSTGNEIPAANSKFWWYIVEGTSQRLITADDLFYVSGQNTNTLTVDPDYMGKTQIRCIGEMYEGTAPSEPTNFSVKSDLKYLRQMPASLFANVNIRTGNIVNASTKIIKGQAEVGTQKGLLANPNNNFFITWKRNGMVAGATDTVIGYGTDISIGRDALGATSMQIPRISIEVKEHTEYMLAADKLGDTYTDKDGNDLVLFDVE